MTSGQCVCLDVPLADLATFDACLEVDNERLQKQFQGQSDGQKLALHSVRAMWECNRSVSQSLERFRAADILGVVWTMDHMDWVQERRGSETSGTLNHPQ